MKNTIIRVLSTTLATVLAFGFFPSTAHAQESSAIPTGVYYEFTEREKYQFDGNSNGRDITNTATRGMLSINGEMKDTGNDVFYVQQGNISVSYSKYSTNMTPLVSGWHGTNDDGKEVNGVKLDSSIGTGAIIVQHSLDGEEWFVDETMTDVFSGDVDLSTPFFSTNDFLQLNGCFYRIIFAYKLELLEGSSKILFWEKPNYKYKNAAEVYTFFIIDQHTVDTGAASPNDKPRREFSEVVNTGKDNGYDMSESKVMDKDDPHFHNSLGYFTVNGYTRETTDEDGNPVFLKTVGDEVTLWFTLTEDIDNLFGNEKLSISEDKNGYDKAMDGGEQTNFKHGTLLVKYTNEEGHSNKAVPYIDFLKANNVTGADTRIKLYEEGDYEVALDYEIRTAKAVPEYNNYKIYFKFSIRNGNTMAFPRDCKTDSELKDGAWTADGFTIDLAESKYLTIDFTRREVVENADGTISTSVRDNKVGKEGSVYSKMGIYEIAVKNQYSDGKPTTVTLYVGADKNILALAKTKMTVDQLNNLIKDGYTIDDDGALIAPVEPTETQPVVEEPEVPVEPAAEIDETKTLESDASAVRDELVPTSKELAEADQLVDTPAEEAKPAPIGLVVIGGIIVVGLIILIIKKKDSRKKERT